MPCNLTSQYNALNQIESTLKSLTRAGYGPGSSVYGELYKVRGQLLGKLGKIASRPTGLLKLLLGLSPGSVKLFYDGDYGWFTDAREKPGAPPVYHHVDDDTAIQLLQGEMTHELEAVLMKPDEYLGE
jgi:hypothetical protein